MKKKKIKILHVAQAAGGVDRYIRSKNEVQRELDDLLMSM